MKHPLDGFIFISYYGEVLSDHEHFDDIFELWLKIFQVIRNTMDDGEAKSLSAVATDRDINESSFEKILGF